MQPNGDALRERLRDQAGLDAAVTQAARQAVLEHARLGFPVAELRDGKVVWVSPEEILRQFDGASVRSPSGNGEP
jgi:hypothetical protein